MSGWSSFWSVIGELFSVPFKFDVYVTGILIVFCGLMAFGYYLISKQIKLVKAEVFALSDYIKCIIYSFIFASGFIIIIVMMFVFAWETQSVFFLFPYTGDITAVLLWAITIVIGFLFIFPLFDLLYMAHSEKNKGLTVFEEFVAEKIIHKVARPYTYLVAIGLYCLLYVLPTLIGTLTGIPGIIVVISVAIALPEIIICYFGTLGFISGATKAYYNIPVMSRSNFLYWGRNHRFMNDLMADTYAGILNRVIFGFQCFLYYWLNYSIYVTLSKMGASQVQVVTTVFQWGVFVSLGFGIWGYFSRFWNRKVKFRWMDILFAAWLVAVTGLNVMVNYVITNSAIFTTIFNSWSATAAITQSNFMANGDFLLLCPVAIVEEATLIVLITYYVLTKKNQFFNNTKYSIVEAAAQTFQPIPLFNLIRVSQPKIRNHAKEELLLMYERIPKRSEIDYLSDKYMNPLFDAVCDSNKNSKEMGIKILEYYIKTLPQKIAPKINEALDSYNYDKKLTVANLVKQYQDKLISFIPYETVEKLLLDKDYHIRLIGIDLAKNFDELENIKPELINSLLNDPDYNIQASILTLISSKGLKADVSLLFEKMNHHNEKIKSAAVLAVSSLTNLEDKSKLKNMVGSLVSMLSTAEGDIEASIISALGQIGNFKKNKIPHQPFLEGVFDLNPKVRIASKNALTRYMLEEKKSREVKRIFNELMKNIDVTDDSIRLTIFEILEEVWIINPEETIPKLLNFLKSKDSNIQKTVSNAISNIASKKPKLVLDKLLSIKEEKTYLKRGIISQTAVKIFKSDEKLFNLIPGYIKNENELVRINFSSTLAGIADIYPDKIDMSIISGALLVERSAEVKKELIKLISTLVDINPDKVASELETILKILNDEDKAIRLAALKMLVSVSKKSSVKIPIESITILLNDKDSFIRESAIKIIGNMSDLNSDEIKSTFFILKELLNDDDWNVKNAAMESIKNLGVTSDDEEILGKIIELIDYKEKYTQIKALEMVASIIKSKPDLIPFKKKIVPLVKNKDLDIRQNIAKILGSYDAKSFGMVFPYIVQLMTDKEKRVRESAQSALVSISVRVPMKDLLPKTLTYFSDETDMLIQQSMALALKRIVKYESKTVKKRLIDLLAIRCEISQDPIICQVLQDLKQD